MDFWKKINQKYRYSLILLRELVKTDFKLRYQGSVLGYLWSLLRPLFLFIILYLVFVYFLKIGADIPHWPVALLLGIVIWNFFAEITNGGLKAIVSRGGLIRKINFPKYIIVISGTISALINLVLNLVIVVIFMIVNGVEPSWTMLLLPLYVLEVFVFGLGMAFILSSIYVKFRDIQHIWEIIMQGLFYASAILYPASRLSNMNIKLAEIVLLNPVAQAVQDARRVFISSDFTSLSTLTDNILVILAPLAIVVVIFITGAYIFKKKSPYFAENV